MGHVYSLRQDLSDGAIQFEHVILTFDLHLENFNSAHNLLTIRHRGFILNVCAPYSYTKTFLVVT